VGDFSIFVRFEVRGGSKVRFGMTYDVEIRP
jgi:hypothetical protein